MNLYIVLYWVRGIHKNPLVTVDDDDDDDDMMFVSKNNEKGLVNRLDSEVLFVDKFKLK